VKHTLMVSPASSLNISSMSNSLIRTLCSMPNIVGDGFWMLLGIVSFERNWQ
jgi:hypothetical protein